MAGVGQEPPHLAADPAEHLDRERRERLLERRKILARKARQRRFPRYSGEHGIDDDEIIRLGAGVERGDARRERLGIGFGAADLQRDQFRIVGHIDARIIRGVGFRHLLCAVAQAHHPGRLTKNLRLGEREEVALVAPVEGSGDVAGQLDMLLLVFADRDMRRLVQEDVCRHQHRIAIEAEPGHLALLGGLLLELGHPVEPAKRGQAAEQPGELGMGADHALVEDDAALGVDAGRDIGGCDLARRGAQLIGVLRLGQRVHDYECILCIVDLHALTQPQDPDELRAATREVTAAYIAAGIDPERCIIFNQSMVSAHAELAWLLGCLTPLGWLNRMTQFKEKAPKQREMAGLGLYGYPVLMAADILLYKATHVPVGEDQKQHVELARDIAGAFNRRYERDFFPLPEPQIFGEATRVMSLRDGTKKMSKSDTSDYSRINMTDDAELIALKIRRAKTDPEPLPHTVAALEQRPEADNLVSIYAALAGLDRETALHRFAGQNFSTFKEALSALSVDVLGQIGGEMRRLLADPGHIDRILRRGAERAAAIAVPVLREVQDISGLLRP